MKKAVLLFIGCFLAAVSYQVIWGLAFSHGFPHFDIAPERYPTLVLVKLSSELLLYGLLAAVFALSKYEMKSWFRILASGTFVVLAGLTLVGVIERLA